MVVFAMALLATGALLAQNEEIRKPKAGRDTQRFLDDMRAREARTKPLPSELKDRPLRQALEEYDATTTTLEPLSLTIGEFITAAAVPFVAVQADLAVDSPISAGTEVRLIGIMKSSQEAEPASFDIRSRVESVGHRRSVAVPVLFPSGAAIATIGVVIRGELVAATRETVDIILPEPDKRGISRLVLASELHPMKDAQNPLDPFSFGGIRVVPRGDRAFASTDEMWLFCELRRPGLDAAGKPQIRMKIEVEGPSGPSSRVLRIPLVSLEATPLAGVPGHFGAGTILDLQKFAPGQYAIRVTMIDSIDSASFHLSEAFSIESR